MVTYVHVSICAVDPSTIACIHVNRQHNALSATTCVHKCQHRLQPKSSSCVYIDNNMYVHAHLQQKSVLRAYPPKPNVPTCLHCLRPLHVCICKSTTQTLCIYGHYVHVSICAFEPSTNACIHVNRQSASTQVIIMCVHRQQPVCLCTFKTKVCLACMSSKA